MKQDNPINKLLKWIKYKKRDKQKSYTPDYNIESRIKPKESGWAKTVAISQMALAAITLVTLFYYVNTSKIQSGLTRNAIKQSHVDDSLNGIRIDSSINIAKISADSSFKFSKQALIKSDCSFIASKKSSQVYEYLTKDDLRPYVTIKIIDQPIIQVGTAFKTRYELVNVGKTPALNVRPYWSLSKWCGRDSSYIDNAYDEFYKSLRSNKKAECVLGSNIIYNKPIESTEIFSKLDSIAFYIDTCRFCLINGVYYSDKFGNRHYTFNCVIFNKDRGIMIYYPKYNWAN